MTQADPRNFIIIPESIERTRLSVFKLMRGLGPREIVFLMIGFFVGLIVLLSGLGLVTKIAIAASIVAAFYGLARFRWRGYHIEQLINIYIQYHLTPRIYLNQRAYPVTRTVDLPIAAPVQPEAPAPQAEPEQPKPKPQPQPKPQQAPKVNKQPKAQAPKPPKAPKPVAGRGLFAPATIWSLIGVIFVIVTLYVSYVLLESYPLLETPVSVLVRWLR